MISERERFEECRGAEVSDAVKELLYYSDGKIYWKKDGGGRKRKGARAGRQISNNGRRQVSVNKNLLQESHVVFFLHNGWWPKVVDHIDRNPGNNNPENLRACDFRLNSANRSQLGKGYKGVSYYPRSKVNPWRVYVGKVFIGYFPTEVEAKAAYFGAAKMAYGEFATIGEDYADSRRY